MFIKAFSIVFSLIFSAQFIHFDSIQTSKMETKGPLSINALKTENCRPDSCIDLVFDTVKVIKIEEKYIELEFSIRNKGTIPAPIFGAKRTKTDNVAVHFYFSGTNRMTRGAMLADGIYLTKNLKESKGMLAPKTTYTERIKMPLKKRISFYGVILLQLDAFDTIREECDETNNVYAITPKWY
jgi:hypothetical protein